MKTQEANISKEEKRVEDVSCEDISCDDISCDDVSGEDVLSEEQKDEEPFGEDNILEHPEEAKKYAASYSESELFKKVAKYAVKVGLNAVYAILLLYYVMRSPYTSKKDLTIILGSLGYFIFPLDVVPDFIPVIGFSDDIAVLVWAVHTVWVNVTPAIKRQAKEKLHDWFYDYDESKLRENW